MADLININDSLKEVNRVFNQLSKDFTPDKPLMNKISLHLLGSVQNNFDNQGADVPGGPWPAKMFPGRNKLQNEILRSLQPHSTENEASVSTNVMGASLFNFGGEVKAKKKLGSVKRRKDVWAMEQFFWAMWYKSNKREKNWMILALHMQTHNSITVPARQYMVLTEQYSNLIIEEIKKQVTEN